MYIDVYTGQTVYDDSWLYNHEGTYGVLGLGKGSPIWYSFVTPDNDVASYSIELSNPVSSLGATPETTGG